MRNGHCVGIRLHRQATDGIDRHGDRHKDREIWRYRAGDETAILFAYYLEFVACRLVVSVRLVRVGCQIDWFRFLTSHKKIF